MKATLRVEFPAADAIAGELGLQAATDRDSGVRDVRDRIAKAQRDVDVAEQRLLDARATVPRVRDAVVAGCAAIADLERAISAERAAELVIPGYHTRLADARAAEAPAVAAVTRRLVAEATRRRDLLQRAADELTPVLYALRASEAALDEAAAAAGGASVAAVTWPDCWQTEFEIRNRRDQDDFAARRLVQPA